MTPEFWNNLNELKNNSTLVLAALESDDCELVERLARESEALLAEIRPEIEARLFSPDRTDEDMQIVDVLKELETLNGAIRDRLSERREEVVKELGEVRTNKLRLVHYRSNSTAETGTPHLLDRDV